MFDSLKKTISFIIILVFMAGVFVSCNSNTFYNQNVEIPTQGWDKNNAAVLSFSIDDSLSNFNFELNIRNTTNYRYSNLYIFLITEFPNGNVSRDTIECILANKQGKWLGKGWGDIKENHITLKSGLRFPLTGNYRFSIQQAMRVDTLMGIHDVGLSLVKE